MSLLERNFSLELRNVCFISGDTSAFDGWYKAKRFIVKAFPFKKGSVLNQIGLELTSAHLAWWNGSCFSTFWHLKLKIWVKGWVNFHKISIISETAAQNRFSSISGGFRGKKHMPGYLLVKFKSAQVTQPLLQTISNITIRGIGLINVCLATCWWSLKVLKSRNLSCKLFQTSRLGVLDW